MYQARILSHAIFFFFNFCVISFYFFLFCKKKTVKINNTALSLKAGYDSSGAWFKSRHNLYFLLSAKRLEYIKVYLKNIKINIINKYNEF